MLSRGCINNYPFIFSKRNWLFYV